MRIPLNDCNVIFRLGPEIAVYLPDYKDFFVGSGGGFFYYIETGSRQRRYSCFSDVEPSKPFFSIGVGIMEDIICDCVYSGERAGWRLKSLLANRCRPTPMDHAHGIILSTTPIARLGVYFQQVAIALIRVIEDDGPPNVTNHIVTPHSHRHNRALISVAQPHM